MSSPVFMKHVYAHTQITIEHSSDETYFSENILQGEIRVPAQGLGSAMPLFKPLRPHSPYFLSVFPCYHPSPKSVMSSVACSALAGVEGRTEGLDYAPAQGRGTKGRRRGYVGQG